jgi:A/G-specific adenine glycosylase
VYVGDDLIQLRVLDWFDRNARDLPWRQDPQPWGVLVSEVMLAQTPVARVEPVWRQWLQRWPTPAALANEPASEIIRAWGRLGYPRRALRLHEAARRIVSEHQGAVPDDYDALRALPGVGDYTAAAVLSFAYGRRALVLDVNVRRLVARLRTGVAAPPAHATNAERAAAAALIPDAEPARWAAASMELGALICTARSPECQLCPVADDCRWLAAGRPGLGTATTKRQRFVGTDRQVRGLILTVLREAEGPVHRDRLDTVWPDEIQLLRALDSLIADGLLDPVGEDTVSLPS